MKFFETSIFTKQITALLPDAEYKELQKALCLNPAAGDIIIGSGGLRKIRWRTAARGKRGGIRVIYYWFVGDDEIFMLLAYGKNEKDDLSTRELSALRSIVESELK
jgi:hypothetical protein